MKLYITGPVGSGKSMLAKKLSQEMDIPFISLDGVVYVPDAADSWGNRKREESERDELFEKALLSSDWVMEDAGRKCFQTAMEQADWILLLDLPPRTRKWRIVKRYLKQKLGVEKCLYRPRFQMLKSMFRWSRNYDTGKDDLKKRLKGYGEKVLTAKSDRDVLKYSQNLIDYHTIEKKARAAGMSMETVK